MPQGERRGVEIDLSDRTYDGVKDDSYLHGGLGQLTDGVVGDSNFKLDVSGMGRGNLFLPIGYLFFVKGNSELHVTTLQ